MVGLDPVAAAKRGQLVLGQDLLKALRQANPDRRAIVTRLIGRRFQPWQRRVFGDQTGADRIGAVPPAGEELGCSGDLLGVENDTELNVDTTFATEPGVGQVAGADQSPARVGQAELGVQVGNAAKLEAGVEQDLERAWVEDARLHTSRDERGQEASLARGGLLRRGDDLLGDRLAQERTREPDSLLGAPNPCQQLGAGVGDQLASISRRHTTVKLFHYDSSGNNQRSRSPRHLARHTEANGWQAS